MEGFLFFNVAHPSTDFGCCRCRECLDRQLALTLLTVVTAAVKGSHWLRTRDTLSTYLQRISDSFFWFHHLCYIKLKRKRNVVYHTGCRSVSYTIDGSTSL